MRFGAQHSGFTVSVHFLDDAHEMFDNLTKKEFPSAFLSACAGCIITFLVDDRVIDRLSLSKANICSSYGFEIEGP